MDLYQIIFELVKERDRIAGIIESLETVSGEKKAGPKRRGRKSMDHAARKEVSERMRRYWARRRSEKALGGSAGMSSAQMGNAA